MKKAVFVDLLCLLLMLLFAYTATSKFLDMPKFVFQMRLAPLPLMKTFAPLLGWLMPSIEIIIAIALAAGMFIPPIKVKALYASVILLSAFEIYIGAMMLSGSHLPCTCGGIISTLGWKQHLLFNGFFILTGVSSIINLRSNNHSLPTERDGNEFKILSRA